MKFISIIYIYIYNLDLPHREQAVGTSERSVGETSIEKKKRLCIIHTNAVCGKTQSCLCLTSACTVFSHEAASLTQRVKSKE
jgi:hypothetical protein